MQPQGEYIKLHNCIDIDTRRREAISQNKYTLSQLMTLFQGPGEKEVFSEHQLVFQSQLFWMRCITALKSIIHPA